MTDYYTPRKAIIVAGSRVGSAMLANALDSHPQISCEREAPLDHKTSVYLREGLSVEQTLRIVLSRPGYQWCMCKISYRQLAKTVSLDTLKTLGVERIIHLWRENALRVVVSAALNTSAQNGEREHPTHAWETPEVSQIELDPAWVLSEMQRYETNVQAMQAQLAVCGVPVLELIYEYIAPQTYENGRLSEETHNQLWDFLGIWKILLQTKTKLINPYPLSEIITNWPDVKAPPLHSWLISRASIPV
jgi:hypothetical protein